jgi:hypothetical protein
MVDEAMDAYVEWREECIRVWDAYDHWRSAARGDTALAHPAYVAALDREERACEVYASVIGQLDQLITTPCEGRPSLERPPRERVGNEAADDD